MPFYTPNGLLIRLAPASAFTLMARLSPKISPEFVLRTTEALDAIPRTLWFIAAGVALIAGASPLVVLAIAAIVATISYVGIIWHGCSSRLAMTLLGHSWVLWVLLPPGLLLGGSCFVAYLLRGWTGLATWAGAWVTAFVAMQVMQFILLRRGYNRTGMALTDSEMVFLQAYRLLAEEQGLPRTIRVTDDEIATEEWMRLVLNYEERTLKPVMLEPVPHMIDYNLANVD